MYERKVIDLTTESLPDAAPGALLDIGVVRHPDGTYGIVVEITSADGTRKAGVLLTSAGAREVSDSLKTLANSVDVVARRGN